MRKQGLFGHVKTHHLLERSQCSKWLALKQKEGFGINSAGQHTFLETHAEQAAWQLLMAATICNQ